MFIGENDYDLDMQVKAEEAREEDQQQKAMECQIEKHKRQDIKRSVS